MQRREARNMAHVGWHCRNSGHERARSVPGLASLRCQFAGYSGIEHITATIKIDSFEDTLFYNNRCSMKTISSEVWAKNTVNAI